VFLGLGFVCSVLLMPTFPMDFAWGVREPLFVLTQVRRFVRVVLYQQLVTVLLELARRASLIFPGC